MLTSATPAESPVAAIARALLVLTEADHAAIFLRSPAGVVTCPWSHNLSERYVAELVTPNGINPWIHILRHPELTCMDLPKTRRRTDPAPWIVRDVLELSSDHAALVDRFVRENLRSMCVWPLGRDGRVIAALAYYYDAPHECSEEEQTGMRAFAAQATTALGAGIAQGIGERTDPHAPPAATPARRIDAHETREAGGPRPAHIGTIPAEVTGLAAERVSLEAEHRRLAGAQAAVAEQDERLEQTRRMLEADAARLAGEREQLAAAWQEVDAAQARAREARAETAAEQQRLADARLAVEDGQARLIEAQRDHAAERDRLADAQRQLEADRAQMAEARAARPEAPNDEKSRSLLREENVRLETLRQDLEVREARLARDRALLEAEARRLADAQAAVAAEKDRSAEVRRGLEVEAARVSAERQTLETERARAAQTQTPPVRHVEVARAQPPEAGGATTYPSLVERAGAANVSDEDEQITAVARRLDARNGHVADYSKRLAEWAEALARALRCSDGEILPTRRAALLHDIGKSDVPEATLKKAAGLTDDERNMFEKEPAVAHEMLKDVKGLSDVATILRHRFERWDGAGHPDRLKGDTIPLGARILSVVDAYGEMITGRPGVPKLYYRDAIAALRRESGGRFDPKIAAAFCRIVASG
jgi:HD-GYP domain-containing protein (c-di-GMP phosphodiesterase class II)